MYIYTEIKIYIHAFIYMHNTRIGITEPTVPIPRLPTPPSNGLGAEEDSLQVCA